jgi:hypothetical protein
MAEPYRAPMTPEPDPYLAAWADLQSRRTAVVLAAGVGIPLSAITTAIGGSMAFLVVLPVMVAAAGASLRRATFLCPRCDHFFGSGRVAQPVPGRSLCSHCHIAEGTPRSAAGPWERT